MKINENWPKSNKISLNLTKTSQKLVKIVYGRNGSHVCKKHFILHFTSGGTEEIIIILYQRGYTGNKKLKINKIKKEKKLKVKNYRNYINVVHRNDKKTQKKLEKEKKRR